MTLVPSLLQAIIRLEGEAVVMHVGDRPYVVTPTGQVDLATRGLTVDAITGIVNQLLPIESQRALDEFGAAQYELSALQEFPGEHFTIVAARGGDDVWAEIRRRRVALDDCVSVEGLDVGAVTRVPVSAAPPSLAEASTQWELLPTGSAPATEAARDGKGPVEADDGLRLPDVSRLWPDSAAIVTRPGESPPPVGHAPPPGSVRPTPPPVGEAPGPVPVWPAAGPVGDAPAAAVAPSPVPVQESSTADAVVEIPRRINEAPAPASAPALAVGAPDPVPTRQAPSQTEARTPSPGPLLSPAPVGGPPLPTEWQTLPGVRGPSEIPPAPEVRPAAVLPLTRNPIRPDAPGPIAEQPLSSLDQLLRLAAARGASMLYLSSASRPSVRVDGEIFALDGAPVFGPNDVESLLLTLMPERNAEALRTGISTEWIRDLPEVGRVRCLSFRDYRGPGGVFRIMPVRAITAEQLGLSSEIQALATEPEGLVLVAGPRASGKRTLISAFVDLINRTRHDHVISIETEINVVHERAGSFISQREVRGGVEQMHAAARGALREGPDVLVLEDVRTAALMSVAFEAAASGQLVIGGFPAHDATGAIDRIIDLYPPEHRRQVQLSLAQSLRGVVSQVLLRKRGGGRLAAREVLLNTPAVASVLADGRTSQLPLAIEGGRKVGMVLLNDALVGCVQSGVVDVQEAYRRSADRAGFLALLKRQGVDTSTIERPA